MKHNHFILLALGFTVLGFGSCMKKDHPVTLTPNLPASPYNYAVQVVIPPGNPYQNGTGTNDNTPSGNPITNAGATLGRVLFYERRFSLNNSISCGSCHKQSSAFADVSAVSTGYEGQKGTRNAIALVNLNLSSNYFWDGRVNTLEAQSLMPVKNHLEMGMESMDNLVIKLKSAPYYASLFNAAYGSSDITAGRVSDALSQFMRSMVSFNSKFDQGLNNNFANFSPQEIQGEATFRAAHCNNCHGGNNLDNGGMGSLHNMPFGNDWANDGLDANITDPGLMDVTGQAGDNGVFKVPSLRNVELTAPYMHDGRFQTLEQVVEHYNSGIQASATLDFRLTQGGFNGLNPGGGFISPPVNSGGSTSTTASNSAAPVQLNLTSDQKAALVAFLKTFTDYSFVNDPKFSDPFN